MSNADSVLNSSASPLAPNLIVKSGRMRLPSGYALPKSLLVLTAGLKNCLLLFHPDEWSPIRDKLLSYPLPDDPSEHARISALRRILLGNARDIQVSARGMIGLDDELIEYAKIEGRVLWYPASKGVELWNPVSFDPATRIDLFRSSPAKVEP